MNVRQCAAVVALSAGLSGCGTMVNAPKSDLEYQRVHKVDLTQSEIFDKTQEWFAVTFVDSKEVIEVANKETGKIIGKGRTEVSPAGLVTVPVRMTIEVEVKPGRYRTTYSNYTGYYGEFQNNPYSVRDARTVGQVRRQIGEIDESLLNYLSAGASSGDDW